MVWQANHCPTPGPYQDHAPSVPPALPACVAPSTALFSGATLFYGTSTLATATPQVVSGWSVDHDIPPSGQPNYFSNSHTSRLTAPVTGKYRVHARVGVNSGATSGFFEAYVGIRLNGTTKLVEATEGANMVGHASNDIGSVLVPDVSRDVLLNAGDYVEVLAAATSANGDYVGQDLNQVCTWFEMTYLGA